MKENPIKFRKPRGKVKLLESKCIACGSVCQASCTFDAIEMNDNGEPIINLELCTGCKKCIKVCPSDALEHYYTAEEQVLLIEYNERKKSGTLISDEVKDKSDESDISNWKGVWIFIEHVKGCVHDVSWELVGKGQMLARDLRVELAAFVIGDNTKHIAEEAFGYGGDKVYMINHPTLKLYRTQPYVLATVDLINKYKPEIVLMGATGLGRDLAGAVATVLRTGLTADCTALTIDKKKRLLEQTRPAFGGNIMATIYTETKRPQMASVRPHVMPKPKYQKDKKGEIIEEYFKLSENEISTKVIKILSTAQEEFVNVEGAKVLVSGGRGMLGKDNFLMLEEFAEAIGGVVTGSRCAIDNGWLDHSRQVGQTGKTVHPKLYIACGISGAIQHLVGMQDSDYIIAINKDKNAPIFEVANLGIIGDALEIIPDIINKIKKSKIKITT